MGTDSGVQRRGGAALGTGDARVLEAIATRDLDAVEDLADRLWYELPARFGPELLDLVAGLPDAVVANRPRLLVTGLLAHQFVAERADVEFRTVLRAYRQHGARLAGRLSTFTRPSDAIAAGLLAMMSARIRGAYETSERIGAWTEEHTTRVDSSGALPWSGNRLAHRPGLVALHRGIMAMVGGDAPRATEHFTRAYEQAGPPPFQHFAGAAACAHLALLAAVRGHHRLAEEWLDRLAACGHVPSWLDHHLLLPARVAEAHLAIDRLDQAAARRALARAGDGSDAVELWPYVAAAHAAFAVAFDDAVKVTLDAACFAHGYAGRPGRSASPPLLRAHADLLAALGEGNQVLALTDESGAPCLAPPAARVRLLAGDDRRALTGAGRALRDPSVSPRDAVEMQLVVAVAHLRAGELDDARHAFARALDLRDHGMLAPFALFVRDEVLALCDLTGTNPASLAPALATDAEPPRTQVPLVVLTPRERAVLEDLAAGMNATAIASAHGVSASTIRSQVKSLYRKLGASGRQNALARASTLGLIPPR